MLLFNYKSHQSSSSTSHRPFHPIACWSLPASLGAPWSCWSVDRAESVKSCSLTGAERSCCSASQWSPVAQPLAPCCLVHHAENQPSGWSDSLLPPEEMRLLVYLCVASIIVLLPFEISKACSSKVARGKKAVQKTLYKWIWVWAIY